MYTPSIKCGAARFARFARSKPSNLYCTSNLSPRLSSQLWNRKHWTFEITNPPQVRAEP